MNAPIVCPGCDKVRPSAPAETGVDAWIASMRAYDPCCYAPCRGRWGTGCHHCHHPSYAIRAMREAVDRWARAKGWLSEQHAHGPAESWMCDPFRGVLIDDAKPAIWDPDGRQHDVDVPTLFVWALVAEAGLEPVAVGLCSTCFGTGRGPTSAHGPFEQAGRVEFAMISKPCHACNGTGKVHRDLTRLALEARLTDDVEPNIGTGETWQRWYDRRGTRRAARDHLAVLADKRQAAGDLVGLQLTLWLAGKTASLAPAIAWLDSRREGIGTEPARSSGA